MKRVAILPTIRKETDDVYIEQTVARFLQNGAEVWMETALQEKAYTKGVRFAPMDTVYQTCDLVVVLGGDGSILRAAQNTLRYDIPLLGINLGRLGYMAELEKDELVLIDNIYRGKYTIEERMTLSVSACNTEGALLPLATVLNDVVIGRGGYARGIDIDLRADGKNVRTIRSDGLILATPTGSTAYSMAAGGSVLDPTLQCICATPIAPISRYACPIVFSGDSVLEIVHRDDRSKRWMVTVDGVETRPLYHEERLIVQRAAASLKMLSLKNDGFFETLNNKISKYELKN